MANQPDNSDVQGDVIKGRIQEAYLAARKQQEIVEIELSRAKIVMVDSDGKTVRVPVLLEH